MAKFSDELVASRCKIQSTFNEIDMINLECTSKQRRLKDFHPFTGFEASKSLSIMTFSVSTFSIMTFSVSTFSITTFIIKDLFASLSIKILRKSNTQHFNTLQIG